MRALYDLPAPAKLNLFLHLVGKRDDGYHLLQSVFALIDWCDVIHLDKRSDGRLQRHDLGAPLPPDDLCLRAARALQQASGCRHGADIHIDKQVPWGAGLGGGSSDAATTLLALNRLWGLNWPRARLQQIALPLGADIPFFVGGHNAFVEGIGERLTPIDLPPIWWAVLKPALAIPTQAIFNSAQVAQRLTQRAGLASDANAAIVASFLAAAGSGGCEDKGSSDASGDGGASGPGPSAFFGAVSTVGTLAPSPGSCSKDHEESRWAQPGFPGLLGLPGENDLQDAALAFSQTCSAVDELGQALNLLRSRYGSSRMSGSGSAVFAPAGSAGQPLSDLAPIFRPDELPPGWCARLCKGLSRHPLADWAAD